MMRVSTLSIWNKNIPYPRERIRNNFLNKKNLNLFYTKCDYLNYFLNETNLNVNFSELREPFWTRKWEIFFPNNSGNKKKKIKVEIEISKGKEKEEKGGRELEVRRYGARELRRDSRREIQGLLRSCRSASMGICPRERGEKAWTRSRGAC